MVAVIFLREMLRQSQISGGNGTRKVYTLSGNQLEMFVDLEQLAKGAQSAANETLDRTAVEKLRELIELKKSGQPYSEIYVISRDEKGEFRNNPHDGRYNNH